MSVILLDGRSTNMIPMAEYSVMLSSSFVVSMFLYLVSWCFVVCRLSSSLSLTLVTWWGGFFIPSPNIDSDANPSVWLESVFVSVLVLPFVNPDACVLFRVITSPTLSSIGAIADVVGFVPIDRLLSVRSGWILRKFFFFRKALKWNTKHI